MFDVNYISYVRLYFTAEISTANITLDGIHTNSVIHVGLLRFRYEYSWKRSNRFASPKTLQKALNTLLGRYNMANERLY